MLTLSWTPVSSTISTCPWGKYTLKKKLITGKTIYEIWQGNELQYNTDRYFEFLKMITGLKYKIK